MAKVTSLPGEEWRWVPGYESLYKVSTLGRVLSMPRATTRGGLLKLSRHRFGYAVVSLSKEGVTARCLVHVLVAAAFLGPRPAGAHVRHLDGNPANAALVNLAYGSAKENAADKIRHGTATRGLTHCPRGHAYDEANTYWHNGYRNCRRCARESYQEAAARRADGLPRVPRRRPGKPRNARPPAAVQQLLGEEWRPTVGYEGFYEVSSLGRVRSLPRRTATGTRGGRLLRVRVAKGAKYPAVSLSKTGVTHREYVHRLVVAAFLGRCPEGMQVRHLDGDPENATLSNLTYGSASENAQDKLAHGTHHWASRDCCAKGHPFSRENTIVSLWPDGTFKQRVCRICLQRWRATGKERRRRQAAA